MTTTITPTSTTGNQQAADRWSHALMNNFGVPPVELVSGQGAVVTDADGVEVGRAQAGWSADPAAEEFKSLKPNRALLESIARQTGGEVISVNNLASFVEKLPNRNAPLTESVTFPLWHQPSVFLLALACFVAEWGLRRWKGMA